MNSLLDRTGIDAYLWKRLGYGLLVMIQFRMRLTRYSVRLPDCVIREDSVGRRPLYSHRDGRRVPVPAETDVSARHQEAELELCGGRLPPRQQRQARCRPQHTRRPHHRRSWCAPSSPPRAISARRSARKSTWKTDRYTHTHIWFVDFQKPINASCTCIDLVETP